jgi:hypothetical protein
MPHINESWASRGSTVFDPEAQTRRELAEVPCHFQRGWIISGGMLKRAMLIVAMVGGCAATVLAGPDGGAGDEFTRGTWDLELSSAYIQPIRFSRDKFYGVNVGGGYYLLDRFALNAEVSGYRVDQPDNQANLIAGDLLLRWHFVQWERLTLFVDGGGGVSMADPEIPEFGTHFNFIGKGGLGATWRLSEKMDLIGGGRYFHLSNGNIHGRIENPSFDGVQFYAGVMFRW